MSWSIDMATAPQNAARRYWPRVGDVYAKAGGKPGFWIVVAVSEETAHVLAFDTDGNCTGAQSYRASYFEENTHRKVGAAMNLPNKIAIAWDEPR